MTPIHRIVVATVFPPPPTAPCADLVVLGRHGKSGMQEFLLGSVAKDVANAAECDVPVLLPTATKAEQP